MHVILGAGGAISEALANKLSKLEIDVRQVARHSRNYTYGTHMSADISQPEGAMKAISGAEIAYMVVGLPYKLSAWESTWPSMMQNVVNTCVQTGTKLVFLDNIYMLSDESMPHMTETSPMNPSSKKGKVRAQVDRILLDAMESGKLQGCIARSADFYGYTSGNKSLLFDLVIKKMVHGKMPQWFYTIDKKHSFTYIPDIAESLLLLSTSDQSWNQIWNVPTAPAMTLREIIALMNRLAHKNLQPQVLNDFMTSIFNLFIPALAEMKELKYQMIQDYVFDSSKFEKAFNFTPTSMEEGLETVIDHIHKTG